MSPEKTLVLFASTFGGIYLCSYSLEQMNKRGGCEISLPNICNYLMFGYSAGMILSITKKMLENEN